ncbi:glucose repression mediator protein [Emydomyces testavorans]|uniref:Glucose repression mediator protein n=1 Tax=Emydomyces testavorans TaxID=2070801 RepID=A0AAF0IGJ4_9EURO|nr:glucose repression mediator protein [Emydomyces testavorans]
MSAHSQRSPTGAVHSHQTALPPHPQVNGHMPIQPQPQGGPPLTTWQKILQVNEAIWLQLGNLCEMMGNLDGALDAYQHALRHNQYSVPAMSAVSCIYRTKEEFPKAIEFLQNILKIDPQSGESWSSLGHCYLMIDNLQDAYSAYQNALYHLRDPKEPKLWYGIGILYDRYGSLDHAEEAFSQVMRMQPDFEKANEIYFRLGIIYKQQQKFHQSLECFRYIVKDPPRPLTEEDIWFQIGHVHEQQKDQNQFEAAKSAYNKVLDRDPQHAKVLQQLGWLHHQQNGSYASQEQAIEYLEKSVAAGRKQSSLTVILHLGQALIVILTNSDTNDAQSWYLLGRCYMSQAKYPKAYEAYQQAVYRDGRNPTFWCSIGVLYYQINQYRDALDAYSRAIRLNPYISEVWYDLGTLVGVVNIRLSWGVDIYLLQYESCNNQIADALDAYGRAADLDPTNVHIKARLQLLQSGQTANQAGAPVPQDVHPQAYQPAGVGVPPGPQWGAQAPSGAPPAQPSGPSSRVTEWARGVNEVQGQAPSNQYDQRETLRGIQPQQPSPRMEQMRQPFPDQQSRNNAGRKGLSPSPKFNIAAPNSYPGHTLPHLGPHPQVNERAPNGAGFGPVRAPPFAQNGPGGHVGANGTAVGAQMPPYGRPFTPPTEIRPLRDERPTSPRSAYPHPPYHQGPPVPQNGGGIASGAPAPAAAIAAAEAAQRERDDRPPSSMKRGREWEADQGPSKKIASEESRARLEEQPGRISSPHERRRRSSSEARRDEQRRAHDNYHPSDAAHHPPSLPPIQHMQPQQAPKIPSVPDTPGTVQTAPIPSLPSAGLASASAVPPEERDRKDQLHAHHEPPARKMEVDEDYDDDGEDDKKAGVLQKGGSPGGGTANGGIANGTSQPSQAKPEPSG